jgi:hypothetical protein
MTKGYHGTLAVSAQIILFLERLKFLKFYFFQKKKITKEIEEYFKIFYLWIENIQI